MASDRAPLSSLFAALAAFAIALFTIGAIGTVNSLHWSMWLVVAWSFALAGALFIWSLREVFNIHWIGNPTLAMVAGASGSAITAIALAFSFAAGKDQESEQKKQTQILEAQVKATTELASAVKELREILQVHKPQPASGSTSK